ncbi:MAG: hypothetical protein K9L78_02175 [Victivallales bacterium]|nr:hypothetical protein [Victivallales bacterium]MCF7888901.1 hypothetical protein [Victivallales bacterium]
MNRTALIPLSVLLLVIIAATAIVAHYQKVLVQQPVTTFSDIEPQDGFLLKSDIFLSYNERPLIHNRTGSYKITEPDLYDSLVRAKKMLVRGKLSGAENELRTILVFYPKNAEATSLLAGIYCMAGEIKLANDMLRRLLKYDSYNATALENYGIIQEKQGHYSRAVSCLLKASLIEPDSPLLYLHISRVYCLMGKKGKAVDNFVKAHELLGKGIYPFTFTSAFDEIRYEPVVAEIMMKIRKGKKKQNLSREKAASGL